MTDWIARHYIVRPTGHYRIKVFRHSVGIERQSPRDSNLLFKRAEYPVYNADAPNAVMVRDTITIDRLIAAYEAEIARMEVSE